jgi:hypothetical protein
MLVTGCLALQQKMSELGDKAQAQSRHGGSLWVVSRSHHKVWKWAEPVLTAAQQPMDCWLGLSLWSTQTWRQLASVPSPCYCPLNWEDMAVSGWSWGMTQYQLKAHPAGQWSALSLVSRDIWWHFTSSYIQGRGTRQ